MIKENIFIYGTGLTAKHVYELLETDNGEKG